VDSKHSDFENVDESESKEIEIVEGLRTTEAQGGPCHQIGGGAPQKQIKTWARDLKGQDDRTIPEGWKIKGEVLRKRKEKDICLTSYTSWCHQWWARIEKDEGNFNREVKMEKERREEENLRRVQKTETTKTMKKMFIQKNFPNFENSPGGSCLYQFLVMRN
jgi:hypothetical protein